MTDALIAELTAALERAAEHIKDMDDGNPKDETGWASDENLDAWLAARAVVARAEAEAKARADQLGTVFPNLRPCTVKAARARDAFWRADPPIFERALSPQDDRA